ncbi:fibrinogen-binding protein [Rhizobium daejeonense]|uniref:Fibrinogen-binding protein n=1 Tax=Rhizobium daejeonense TaxID=240521 RepID=A0A6M1S5S7_9HYPH|nr:fibrinogen-binding protein [Rhizobium daejeonense]NGO63758.1 fibrinogen-binding protein [Rhizobium daejeonense]
MEMSYGYNPQGDETNVGALADGFANSAINSTEVDDGSTGYVGGVANGDNRENSEINTDNSIDVDLDSKIDVDVATDNGNNRDNEYDWSYDSKSYSNTETDTDIKTITDNDTTTVTDSYNTSEYDWSYDSKSYSNTETDIDTDIKTVTETDTDIKTTTDSFNISTSDSFNSADNDFGQLDNVHDFGNLGIAGGDLTFEIGDDFSFTLNVDNILNDSLNGAGNDSGFNAVQASHLADQDTAWEVRMENGGAQNYLSANGGTANGSEGMDLDAKGWDLSAGDDVSSASTADASAILANSGFHFEFVQGANLLSNTIDSSVIGGDSYVTHTGEDTGA